MTPLSGDVLVLGLGKSGIATAEYLSTLLERGSVQSVTAVDAEDTERTRAVAAHLADRGVGVLLGVDSIEGSFDLAIASPGIKPCTTLMMSAREASPRVVSEIEFAFEQSRTPWCAITGTNGKTTTTSIIAHLLSEAGHANELVGNIGRPSIAAVADAGETGVMVAEVSSFQLALTESFRPRVSVLLNVTPDHIDWHGSLECYARDKGRIFTNQASGDTAVIDVDDPGSAAFAEAVESRGVRVMRVSTEGLLPGGAGLVQGELMLDLPGGPITLLSSCDLLIRGSHNVSNALAAAAAAWSLGVDTDDIACGLSSFEPIEHRLEPVGVVDGVEYFNDSKATNPDATLKALAAFQDTRLVLLLGGRNKGNTFGDVARSAQGVCRAVIVFGEASDDIVSGFLGLGLQPIVVPTMAEAVRRARETARVGDAVVLSPACASFDEFDSYEHRGAVFADIVSDMTGGEADVCTT